MNTAIADYLTSLEFPTLIAENNNEECLSNFRQEYNFILQSLLPELPPLLETPEKNQYLIAALLKTLAERESLLRNDINQLLYLLLPSPKTGKHVSLKSTYLDEIIALFGMEREYIINPEQALTPSIPESDADIKVRLASRLEILNNTGTESYYKHHFLSLNPTIQDVLIKVKQANSGKLSIYLLAKTPRPKSTEAWLDGIKITLEEKAIIPVADSCELVSATLRYYKFLPKKKDNNEKEDYSKINKFIKAYADKKYRFNSVISSAEFFSYLADTSLENLDISLYRCDEEGENESCVEKIECQPGEVPCLVENNGAIKKKNTIL